MLFRSNNQWDITVRNFDGALSTYRTTRLISNIGAESIRGRGTRVWEAQKLWRGRPQEDTVALKDSWIDDDREREAVILQKIIESAPTPKAKEILIKHLLTVVCYGDVFIDGQTDQTHTLLRRGADVPSDLPPFVLEQSRPAPPAADGPALPEEGEGAPVGSDVVQLEEERSEQVVTYCIKAHHRIAFKEVGTSIDMLNSVSGIFAIMAQSMRGEF